jgi:hypothetical protein
MSQLLHHAGRPAGSPPEHATHSLEAIIALQKLLEDGMPEQLVDACRCAETLPARNDSQQQQSADPIQIKTVTGETTESVSLIGRIFSRLVGAIHKLANGPESSSAQGKA